VRHGAHKKRGVGAVPGIAAYARPAANHGGTGRRGRLPLAHAQLHATCVTVSTPRQHTCNLREGIAGGERYKRVKLGGR
jgi:hypothetical protein